MKKTQLFKSVSEILSICIFLSGSVVLIGWIFDIPVLKSISPDFVAMKANTAVCFVFIGLSLWLSQTKRQGNQTAREIARLCAFVVFLTGFLTFWEYMLGWNLGIDQLLFKESATAVLTSAPGRMAFNTSIIFVIIGIALLLCGFEAVLFSYLVQLLVIPAGIIALLSFVGYLYGASPLYIGLKFSTAMAVHTCVLFMMSCIGCLFARPEQGLMKDVSSDYYGGLILRRILPVVIVIPLVLGWFKIHGEKTGLFSNEFGVSFVAVCNLLVVSLFVYILSVYLNRMDAKRKQAQQRQTETLEQLEKTNRRLQQEVAQRTEAEKSLAKANDDLQFAVAQLSRSNRQLSEFAHLATHDLKTPLRGIGTLAEWLVEDYYDKFDDYGREQVNLLVKRVRRMNNLINAVLQYSTIARNKQNERQVDLDPLIKSVIANIKPTPNITITVNQNLPVLTCEEEQITQVFYNLVANAVIFMDKPDGLITIDFEDEKYFWKFSVSDNGPGIEPQHFERIFQLFQTLSDREEAESTGIGLTMAKRIVELYGGKIWLTSTVGVGSTFFFTLPKQPTAVACQSPQQAQT